MKRTGQTQSLLSLSVMIFFSIIILSIALALAYPGNPSERIISIHMVFHTKMDIVERYWSEFFIEENRYLQFVKYIGNQIIDERSGTLDSEDLTSLLEYVEEMGFFTMDERYNGGETISSEREMLSILIKTNKKQNSVLSKSPFGPNELKSIQDRFTELVRKIKSPPRYGYFLRADELSPLRAKSLEKKFEFHIFSQNDLEKHPNIKDAIMAPIQFVYVESLQNARLGEFLIEDYNYFFVKWNKKSFQLNVYVRSPP